MKNVQQNIHIILKSFDHRILDRSVANMISIIRKNDGKFKGPIFLPKRIKKFTLNRSPHIDKKSREQFEMRIYKRLIPLSGADSSIIQALSWIQLPAGVEVEIIVIGGSE